MADSRKRTNATMRSRRTQQSVKTAKQGSDHASQQVRLPPIPNRVQLPRNQNSLGQRAPPPKISEACDDATELSVKPSFKATKQEFESEVDKVHRQLWMIERDQTLCKPTSPRAEPEKEEPNINLAAHKKSALQRKKTVQSCLALVEEIGVLEEKLQKEKQLKEHIKKEMADEDLKQRKAKGGMTDEEKAQQTERSMDTLDNRLYKATVWLTEDLARDRQQRQTIKTLHAKHVNLKNISDRQEEELQNLFNSYKELSASAIDAYDISKLAQSKAVKVKEKVAVELAQYKAKVELLNILNKQESSMQELVSMKCCKRSAQDEDRKMGHRHLSGLKVQRMDSSEETPTALKKKFEKIQTEIFSLSTFINERNKMIEQLKSENVQIQKEIDKLRAEGLQQEKDDLFLLKNLDEELWPLLDLQSQYENQSKILSQDLDAIVTRVCNMLPKTECDRPMLKETHTSIIRERKITSSLRLLEEKVTDLLTIQALLCPTDLEKDYSLEMLQLAH